MSYIGRLAKGSLLVGTGLGNVELPIGANGTRLEADSTQPDGLKWATPSSAFTWNNNTAVTNVTMSPGNGYIQNNNSAPIFYALPTTAPVGSYMRLVNNAASQASQIQQGSGQQILYLGSNSTLGVGGTLTLGVGNCVELLCTVADTTWRVINSMGGDIQIA
jgi:hypothetical protein